MRTAFIQQLIKEARSNPRIFLIVGDLGFSVVEPFASEFPDRYLNVGVAEQNMAGIAAGLALEGYNVFIYSIANFPTLRCMEQIRYDICYHNLNVKIVAVGGGFAYGALGPSHHATEDIGMMKTLPNLSVIVPGDPVETQIITSLLCGYNGPCYLRLGKAGEKVVHKMTPEIEWGCFVEIKPGNHTAVCCAGSILHYCNDFLSTHHPGWGLFSVPFIKPMNYSHLKNLFLNYKGIISIEEHQRNSGLGATLLFQANELYQKRLIEKMPSIKIIGIDDVFFDKSGDQDFIRNSLKISISFE